MIVTLSIILRQSEDTKYSGQVITTLPTRRYSYGAGAGARQHGQERSVREARQTSPLHTTSWASTIIFLVPAFPHRQHFVSGRDGTGAADTHKGSSEEEETAKGGATKLLYRHVRIGFATASANASSNFHHEASRDAVGKREMAQRVSVIHHARLHSSMPYVDSFRTAYLSLGSSFPHRRHVPRNAEPPPFTCNGRRRQVGQRGDEKGHLEADVARLLANRSRPQLGVHERHDAAKGDDKGAHGRRSPRQEARLVPRGRVVRIEAPPTEDEMLRHDDGDKGGRPVADEGDEVLEVLQKVAERQRGDGHDDGRRDDGEDVPRHPREPRRQRLQVEGDGVKGAAGVAEQRQAQHDDEELAKAVHVREHGREDAPHEVLVELQRPVGVQRQRAADGRAEDHEHDGRQQEAPVGVVEGAPRGHLGVEVGGEVARERRPGDLVARHDHAKVEHLARPRRLRRLPLLVEVPAADADGDEDAHEGDEVGVRLEGVEHLEAGKGDEQRQHGDDDDADRRRQPAVGHGRQALAAEDEDDDGEAHHGDEVEQHRDRDGVPAEAVASLDHLPHARLGTPDGEVAGRDGGDEAEEDDDEGRVPQAEAVDGRAEHAKEDSTRPARTGSARTRVEEGGTPEGERRRGSPENVGVDGEPDGKDVEEARVGALLDGQRTDAVLLDAAHAKDLAQQRRPLDVCLRLMVLALRRQSLVNNVDGHGDDVRVGCCRRKGRPSQQQQRTAIDGRGYL
ncbi:hypothetical protein RJ55_04464 [Drechmeria coniospora]|nr:hypothetical protein RJ55_04464 [Drechmeria coniospora]